MVALGFFATALFWPGIPGAATTPRWTLLFLVVPWLIRGEWIASPAHVCGSAFIAVAALSFLWTASPLDTIGALFVVLAWVGLFLLGSQTKDLRPFITGAGLGLWLSSAVAVAQWFGWQGVPQVPGYPAGLFVNGNYMAEAAALVLVAALAGRIWWLIPGMIPALLLPNARGAALAVTVALVVYFWRRAPAIALGALVGIIGAGIWLFGHPTEGLTERLQIWQSTWNGLTLLGHGMGSFWSVYPAFDIRFDPSALPDHAHNEFLHIAFELGVAGLLAALAFCLALAWGPINTARLVLVALFVESCFAFPLHLPATAAIGFIVAGHAVRSGYLVRAFDLRRRRVGAAGLAIDGPGPVHAIAGPGGADYAVRSPVPHVPDAARAA